MLITNPLNLYQFLPHTYLFCVVEGVIYANSTDVKYHYLQSNDLADILEEIQKTSSIINRKLDFHQDVNHNDNLKL